MNCALCDSESVISDESLAMGWDEYLINERDFPIFGRIYVPICGSCIDRWARHRFQGRYGADPADEASELLDDLILDNLYDTGIESDNAGRSD